MATILEAQAREVKAQCRNLVEKISELQKAKEVAERKGREAIATMEAVKAEIRNEKQINSSTINLARKANTENDIIKRARQSLWCSIHVFGNDDCTINIENNIAIPERITLSPLTREMGVSPLSYVKKLALQHGEIYVQLCESVRGCDVFLVQPTCHANENLMELLVMIDACRRASAKTVTAVIPYFGYARADRKEMAPAKQIKVIKSFQKDSAQLDMTIEMMSESIEALSLGFVML